MATQTTAKAEPVGSMFAQLYSRARESATHGQHRSCSCRPWKHREGLLTRRLWTFVVLHDRTVRTCSRSRCNHFPELQRAPSLNFTASPRTQSHSLSHSCPHSHHAKLLTKASMAAQAALPVHLLPCARRVQKRRPYDCWGANEWQRRSFLSSRLSGNPQWDRSRQQYRARAPQL